MSLPSLPVLVSGAVVAQSLLPAAPGLADARAPLLVGVTLYAALTRERGPMLAAAVISGLIHDSLSLVPPGYTSLCLCVVALAAHRFREIVYVESVITAAFFGAAGAFGVTAATYGLLLKDGAIRDPFWWAAMKCCGSGLLGMLATPAVFLGGVWLDGGLRRRRRRAA